MDASPYYSTLGRGNESQLKVDDADGLLSKWPLFLDNSFVPRGYAVALVDMTGTNHSTGCPTVQGVTDNLAAATVIDWFKGRRVGRGQDGAAVPAPGWFNGKTGMIGKAYDGSLAAASAVTGVDGLTTIVAESGPYDYYDYTRSNGVIQRGNHYVASIETAPGTLTDFASWPVPGAQPTQLFLTSGANAGTLSLAPQAGGEQTTTFTDSTSQRETAMIGDETTVTANRRVFLSPPLAEPVRISGTPVVQLDASANKTSTHLGAILVDYGPAFPRVSRTSDGVQTLTTSNSWGQASATDNGCYKDVGERIDTTSVRWRVTKGVLDAGHRTSRLATTPIVADQRYPFSFPLLPNDYTFPAGTGSGS